MILMAAMQTQPEKSVKIFLRTSHGFGLGDSVQFSIVLKHLARYRPHWIIDVFAPRGIHSALNSLCNAVTHEWEPIQLYDKIIDLALSEDFGGYTDRPDTKMAYVMQQKFGLPYDADLGRYECRASQPAMNRAGRWLARLPGKAVIVHYEGSSSPHRKNLALWQADEICDVIRRMDRIPVLFDFKMQSPLVDQKTVFRPDVGKDDLWGSFGNGDAEMMSALIRQAEAFIGVDSGPGKIASATETPTLICWTINHPKHYHDPAPNTTHLMPDAAWDTAGEYFANYLAFSYSNSYDLVNSVVQWLGETLDCTLPEALAIRLVIPPSLASAAWVVAKMRPLSAGRPIDITVAAKPDGDNGVREMLEATGLVRSVVVKDVPIFAGPERPRNTRGHELFVAEGVRDGRHFLIPEIAMQFGRTLAEWMPEVPVDHKALAMLPGDIIADMKERGWI
jgi:hypothetical protein